MFPIWLCILSVRCSTCFHGRYGDSLSNRAITANKIPSLYCKTFIFAIGVRTIPMITRIIQSTKTHGTSSSDHKLPRGRCTIPSRRITWFQYILDIVLMKHVNVISLSDFIYFYSSHEHSTQVCSSLPPSAKYVL
jgi:hypothetical protein